MTSLGHFVSLFLGIVIYSTLLSQSENDFGPRITSGQLYSIFSVETIVDSRFKLLAAEFQDQIDHLKDEFFRKSKTANKVSDERVLKSQHRHKIKKRQTQNKPLPPKKFENMNSSCTFFYPDYPDAGLEKSKNDNIEMLKAGNELIKKQENNTIKSRKPICEYSTPFCTFIYPDHHRAGTTNGKNSTTVKNNQPAQYLTEVHNTSTTCKDLLWREIEVFKMQNNDQSKRIDQLEQKLAREQNLNQLLNQTTEEIVRLKIQNSDQSNRIDQLEQKFAILQNAPPASSSLTKGNNKDKMRNGATSNMDGQVSIALTPPSSCQDLAMLDYYLDGLYLVKNKETKKIQTVFCKFSADNKGGVLVLRKGISVFKNRFIQHYAGSETIIGYNDIKTAPVFFLVTRRWEYAEAFTTIPFDAEVFNYGDAMNRKTGVFTAPKKGLYSFTFKTRNNYNTNAQLFFRVNQNNLLYVEGYTSFENMPISTVLDLNVNDTVDCYLSRGSIYSNLGGTFFPVFCWRNTWYSLNS